jgi:hypothetical protein
VQRTVLITTVVVAFAVISASRAASAQEFGLADPPASSEHASDLAPIPSTWKGALVDSLHLLMIEHGIRVAFQHKTRRELSGGFFADYRKSLLIPDSWEDSDSWAINYVGHPIHGAAAGFIWLSHEPGAENLGFSRPYWASRARGTAWAAVYSLQFEIGPLSEASIGNVGMRRETVGWVDHVVTPVGALGLMVAEDALDRYLITRIESWTRNRFLRAASRMILNPSRTLSYTAQGRIPWSRTERPIR